MDYRDLQNIKTLLEMVKKVKEKGWYASVARGSAAVGRTFESALGLSQNEFEVPDYECLVEIKTKSIRDDGLYKFVTLFSAVPDNDLFEIKRIVGAYGYPSKKDKNLKVFNMEFCANKVTCTRNYVYKLVIDREHERLVLKVFNKHTGVLVDDKISWTFDMLKTKLYRKLRYLLYVKALRRFQYNMVFFRYVKSRLYVLKDFEHFLNAMEKGYVKVTFKIGAFTWGHKYGDIKNHGTSFSIHEDYLEELFEPFDLKVSN